MTIKQTNINKQLKIHFALLMVSCFVSTYLSGPPVDSMPLTQWLVSGLVFSFIAVFPLLFFIPTVLSPNPRSVSWLGFFLLAYLVWGVMKIFSPNGVIGGLLICTFIFTTFFYTVIWLRPFKKESKRLKKEANE